MDYLVHRHNQQDRHNNRLVLVDYLEINSKEQLPLEELAHCLVVHSNSSKDKHLQIYCLVVNSNKQLQL